MQRVDICQSTGSRKNLAIGILVIACHHRAIGIYNTHHVALQVGDVIVHRAVVLHGIGQAALIVEEVEDICSPAHAHQLAAGVVVAVGSAVHSLAGSQSAGIIGEAQAVGSVGGRRQAPAVLPRHCPPGAVAVAGGIAYGVVDNRLPVKAGEQILPVGITVGVTVSGSAIGRGQDIARTGGHGIQTAVGRIVSIPLGIGRTAQLPVLSRQLVILIVALAGPQNGIAVLLSLTVDRRPMES